MTRASSLELTMAMFTNLPIVQKIGLLCAAGVVVSTATGVAGLIAQSRIGSQAAVVRDLQSASGLMHHLDTREAELKVDAYRALAEADVAPIIGDLPDDLASVTETLDDLAKLTLPADVRAAIADINGDALAFNTFIDTFVHDTQQAQASVRGREPEIAERNHAVDDKLGALQDSIDAHVADELSGMRRTQAAARWATIAVIGTGIVFFLLLSVPVIRAISGPVRRSDAW